jgi:hypothetical protein
MKIYYTHIIFILDKSGSMAAIRNDAMGGFNNLLEDQKKGPGRCTFSLYQFSHLVKAPLVRGELIQHVVPLDSRSYTPDGPTALYDAIGRAVVDEGDWLAAMPEESRPGLVILAILTDGEENSSRHFGHYQVKEMLEVQQEVFSWKVMFLGVGLDAYAQAGALGIERKTSGYVGAGGVAAQASYASASSSIGRARSARAGGQSLGQVENELGFLPEEREAMLGKPKPADPAASNIIDPPNASGR